MVHKIIGQRIGAFVFGDDIGVADHDGGGTIPEPHFIEISGFGFALIRGRHQNVSLYTAADGLQRCYQGRTARLLRSGKIRGEDVGAQIQGRGDDTRVLAVGKRESGRSQKETVKRIFVFSDQTVTRSGNGHGD